jgi:hypothetical protein
MRFRPKIIVLTLIVLAVVIPFLKAYVIAYAYNVPVWFLLPRFFLLSGVQLERKMNVTVQPLVPFSLGDPITVKVVDAKNATPIEGATVRVSKDGVFFAPMFTDSSGTAIFEYPGEPTIIEVSKSNYETITKVIPRIPDQWIRADFLQWISNIITWIITLASAGAIVIKFRSEFKITIKRK